MTRKLVCSLLTRLSLVICENEKYVIDVNNYDFNSTFYFNLNEILYILSGLEIFTLYYFSQYSQSPQYVYVCITIKTLQFV